MMMVKEIQAEEGTFIGREGLWGIQWKEREA